MARHLLLIWVAIAVLAGTTALSVYVALNTQAHQNDALSALICHAEAVVKNTKSYPPAQRRKALRFYQQQIRLEHLNPCD